MTTDVALTLPTLDEIAMTDTLIALPAKEVPAAILHLRALKQMLARLEAVGESRCESEWSEIAPLAAAWIAPDGTAYVFSGEHKREVADADGLRAALVALVKEKNDVVAASLVSEAFRTKVEALMTPLNSLEKLSPEYEDTIRDFRRWTETKKHLREAEATASRRK